MKFTECSSPAIAKFEFHDHETGKPIYEWKVSPHLEEDDYDTGAEWCDTKAEALEVAREMLEKNPKPAGAECARRSR